MKKIVLPVALVAVLLLQSFETICVNPIAATPVSLGEVVYVVPLRTQIPVEQRQNNWAYEQIEPAAQESLFSVLFQKVRDLQLDVYKAEYPFNEKLEPKAAKGMISVVDSMQVEDPYTYEMNVVEVINDRQPSDVVAVIFHEEWLYDAASLTIEKKVKGLIPVLYQGYSFDGVSYSQRILPSFYIPFQSGVSDRVDFRAANVEFDFAPDSVRLWDYPSEDRFIKRSYYKGPEGKTIQDNLLKSFKLQSAVSTTKLHGGTYPHPPVTVKSERKSLVNRIDSAQIIRFRESWSADLDKMVFTKKVQGVYLGREFERSENSNGVLVTYPVKHFSAYLPLNSVPVNFIPNGKVTIENFSCNASFYIYALPGADQLVTHDTMQLQKALGAMVNDGRSGKMPVYSMLELWRYNDPLDSRRVPMTPAQIYDVFVDSDYVLVEEDNEYVERAMISELKEDALCGFDFIESWSYDPAVNTFSKSVKTLGVCGATWVDIQETMSLRTMFNFDVNRNFKEPLYQPKFLIAGNVIATTITNDSEYHTAEDEKGTPIPTYNPTFDRNLTNELRFQMVQQMINQALAGKLVAWTTDSVPKPMSVLQFKSMLDTVAARHKFNPHRGKEYYMFNEMRFTEDWYYNPAERSFGKMVKAITFGHRDYQYDDYYIVPEYHSYFTIKVNGTK